MRVAGLFLLVLSLAACSPPDAPHVVSRNIQLCSQPGLPPSRLRACSAVVASARVNAEQRVEALITRGVLRAEGGQDARAVADFGRALRIDPDNIQALLERGWVHQGRGAYEAAVRDYDAILAVYPNFPLALQRREEALSGEAGAFRVEIDRLSQEIAQSPNNAALLNNRCWVRAINGQELQEALADCDQALRIRPNSANVLDSRGLVNYKLGNFDAALADYDAALGIEDAPHYRYGRGVTLIALGREADGRAAMAQAIAADAQVAGMYYGYGVSP